MYSFPWPYSAFFPVKSFIMIPIFIIAMTFQSITITTTTITVTIITIDCVFNLIVKGYNSSLEFIVYKVHSQTQATFCHKTINEDI